MRISFWTAGRQVLASATAVLAALVFVAAPAAAEPDPGFVVIGGGGSDDPPPEDCTANATGSVSVSPSLVLAGQNVTVTWSGSPQLGCTTAWSMTGPGFDGPLSSSGSRTVTVTGVGVQRWTLLASSRVLNGVKNPIASATAQSMTPTPATSPIAAAVDSAGRLRLIMARDDTAVVRNAESVLHQFVGWSVEPGQLRSVAAETDGSGRIVQVGYDAYGRLFAAVETAPAADGFSGWTQLATQGVINSVALARNGDGRLELFATRTDGTIQHARQTTTGGVSFGGWSTFPGYLSSIVADTNADGRIEVAGVNSDGVIWHLSQTALNSLTWSNWLQITGMLRSVAMAREYTGKLLLVGTDPAGALVERWQSAANSSTWGDAIAVPDGHAGPVAAEADKNGQLMVFGLDGVAAMSYRIVSYPGTSWTPLIQYKPGTAFGAKRKVLVIPVNWSADGDTPAAPQTITLDQITAMIDNQWWSEVSYGVFPGWQVTGRAPIAIDPPGGFADGDCGNGWPHRFLNDIADSAFAIEPYDPDDYSVIMFYFSRIPCFFAGSTMPDDRTSYVWMNGGDTEDVQHELGHTLGLHHAHSVRCVDRGVPVSYGGTCTSTEYGDPYDGMALSGAGFNSFERDRLGWMIPGSIVDVPATGGGFTLSPLELVGPGMVRALRLSDGTPLWIEYREGIGVDTYYFGQRHSVLIYTTNDEPASSILDLTPATDTFADANLAPGSTWISPTGNFKVTLDWAVSTNAHLTISLNRTTVPDLVGGSVADAQAKLRDANLSLGWVNEVVDPNCAHPDRVSGQSMPAGSSAIPGTAIAIDVTVMPAPPAVCQ